MVGSIAASVLYYRYEEIANKEVDLPVYTFILVALSVLMICILVLIPQSMCNLKEYVEEHVLDDSLAAPSKVFWVLGLSLIMLPCSDINRMKGQFLESGAGIIHVLQFIFLAVYQFSFGLLISLVTQSYVSKCRPITSGTDEAAFTKINNLYEQFLALKDGCQLGLFASLTLSTLYLIMISYTLLTVLLFSCLQKYRTVVEVTDLAIQVAAFILIMYYYGWTADKCFQSFKGLTVPLRYLYIYTKGFVCLFVLIKS